MPSLFAARSEQLDRLITSMNGMNRTRSDMSTITVVKNAGKNFTGLATGTGTGNGSADGASRTGGGPGASGVGTGTTVGGAFTAAGGRVAWMAGAPCTSTITL